MKRCLAALAILICAAMPAYAQDLSEAEIVVTGTRMSLEEDEFDNYDGERPAVGVRRTADVLVQPVAIRGDTRDQAQRRYVQHALAEQAHRVLRWVEEGAVLYVCGSRLGMAEGVDAALAAILGRDRLTALAAAGRYRRDVY